MKTSDALSSIDTKNSPAILGTLHSDTGVFSIIDLSVGDNSILSFEYSRKTFYTVTLLQGDYQLEFEDRSIDISGNSLLFTTTKVPFGIKSSDMGYAGISCVFKEEFITKANSGYRLLEFPIYKPGRQNIYSLTDEQTNDFITIYNKIFDETHADSVYKENLQRTHLLELIFNGQKLAPANSFVKTNNTSEVITCSFIRLLESQFPVESQQDTIKLKTPKDFADSLSLHPNYLNRQVKLSKGRTVSNIIASRLIQEAMILLKLTDWHIAEISYSLGFEEPSHFNLFFKKHTEGSPTDYRKLHKE
ncbi:helix-turn-helix domain-containing protein [Chitinophaga sancti]|uniref:Helix-turn-helix domain-containing protein n=1 Tax=Chitinophaga sancti TaxID=1004 RepID=A0A1K1R537_9BACT|nr:response regulator transcription factor [Chitinophaga sancti]WQD64254.1 helix-turn-helix transcriptional regulator [Chitinophaga sancti]WQG90122.1 helix-turn-helix transcriptional regulator [Chitinophaga sancti]SFW67033.1 Helix-turn-helix domain-containing protein [Chitinophaga sancti]